LGRTIAPEIALLADFALRGSFDGEFPGLNAGDDLVELDAGLVDKFGAIGELH
jgi:hypothetical protein